MHPEYTFGKNIFFEFVTTDNRMMVRQPSSFSASDTDVNQVLEFMKDNKYDVMHDKVPKTPILLGIKLDSAVGEFSGSPVQVYSKSYNSYFISDSSAATLIAMGINKENVKDYLYHVVEDDSIELVPWSKISRLDQQFGAKKPYGFIGTFRAPGKQVLVEVRNAKNYGIRDGVVFDWRVNFKPILTQMIIITPEDASKRIPYFNVNYAKMNRGWATRFDDKTGVPLNLAFPIDSVDILRLSFKAHEVVPYAFFLIKKTATRTDTTTLIFYNREDIFDVESKNFHEPGKYEIIIQKTRELGYWPEDQILRIPFEVQPPPIFDKKVYLKQALPYMGATLGGVVLLFWGFRRNSRIKLARSMQARQTTQLQLKSIRSQLNPHFMFNALTSIQNLMNKNDTKAANHYLAKFADLTRTVLDSSDQELISLEDELKILDDYLQMEKLRFGFQYQIEVDNAINIANTEVPAMLLQPFVENGVKHGVSGLLEKGLILIHIWKDGKGIVLKVVDNGKGFDRASGVNMERAFGIKLSEERIVLLNKVYKGQPSSLQIESGATGTAITIRLANWTA